MVGGGGGGGGGFHPFPNSSGKKQQQQHQLLEVDSCMAIPSYYSTSAKPQYGGRNNMVGIVGGGGGGGLLSSQSSRSSAPPSELSDDLLESLPSVDERKSSFSRVQPLPLPDSMQQRFTSDQQPEPPSSSHAQGPANLQNLLHGGPPGGGGDPHSPMQIGGGGGSDGGDHMVAMVMGEHLATALTTEDGGTHPLHHMTSTTGYYDSFPLQRGNPVMMNGYAPALMNQMRASPNMVVGDMASLSGVFMDETQYLENLIIQQREMMESQVM